MRKDIEKWGSGLRRIYEACREADVTIEFKKLKSGFSVIFYRKEGQTTPQVTPQVVLTELESKILYEIIKNSKISRTQLAKVLGISSETVKEYLAKLKRKGILIRRGKTSGGYWEILEH